MMWQEGHAAFVFTLKMIALLHCVINSEDRGMNLHRRENLKFRLSTYNEKDVFICTT
jgi:hypothetical protein